MNRRLLFNGLVGLFVLVGSYSVVWGGEKLDRALIALEREDGSVFLSWRLLDTDSDDIAFKIKRRSSDSAAQTYHLTKSWPCMTTNFIDLSPNKRNTYIYELYETSKKNWPDEIKKLTEVEIKLTGQSKSYHSIPLNGDYDFQKVGIADLDGDGTYEYLIKQPNFNTDPYQRPGYWKRSTTTYKIESYRMDGTMMWRHDMGWSIEAGIWYSPWIVYDVDGDGKAEVYCKAGEGDPRDEKGLVQTGPEYLIKLDGQTGKVLAKIPWLSRDGFLQYNYYCRNFLTVAYLDGRKPSLVMQRGTYRLIKMQALDKDFNRIWYWESTQEKKKYGGQSGHGLITADIDADGRDELVIGSAVLDEYGKGIWTTEMGHPDAFYVADIDPDHPGL